MAEIFAAVNGENDGAAWIGFFRLKDGRFLVASGSCDYTGWDCRAGNSLTVAATFDDAVQYAMGDDQRQALGITLVTRR